MHSCNDLSFGSRLKFFIDENFRIQKEFTDFIGINYSTLYRYIKEINQPTIETLCKFKKAGLSIEWLVDGSGIMFAKNSKGLQLLEKYKGNNKIEKSHPFERIKNWINDNYGSLRNFSIVMDLNFEDLHSTFYEHVIPDATFANTLENCGCNLDWILTGEGSEYANNPIGEILKSKKYSSEIKSEKISKEKEQLTDKISMVNLNDLFELLKLAVRTENNRNKLIEEGGYNEP